MVRPGYGIKYACISPFQIKEDLEASGSSGLFFAGRVNSACTYEGSLAQGLIAGINAGRRLRGVDPLRSDEILQKGAGLDMDIKDVSRET
jgi:tRNA uridine 5-carboxymethylaminomethyl modification enzyme